MKPVALLTNDDGINAAFLHALVAACVAEGFDVVVANWRPVIGPRGMSAEQVTYWEERLARFTQTDEWKRELADTGAVAHFMNSRELAKYFAAQHAEFKTVLGEIGLAR